MLEQRPLVDTYAIAVKLAGMLLIQNGQITIREIETLPFVRDRLEAEAIAQRLAKAFTGYYRIEVAEGVGSAETRLRLGSRYMRPNKRSTPLSV